MLAGASRPALAIAAVAAFAGGATASLQSRLNGELSVRFQAPLDAALWSFGSGLVVLSLLLLASRPVRTGLGRLPEALRSNEIRWWECIGGAAGGAFVAVQTYAVPLAGVAIFTIAVVGGQTGNALVVDRFGLGPAGRSAVTVGRSVAAGIAVVGVGIAVSGRGGSGGSSVVLPAVLALVVGGFTTVQQATNGRVNGATGSAMATTWLNFATGCAFLVGLAVVRLLTGTLTAPVSLDAPWWAWLGAPCGIAFIAIAAVVVRYLGLLVFTLVMLTGQLVAAVALDLLSPATRSHIGIRVVLGVLVTLGAAVLAGWSAQRQPGRVAG